MHTDDVRRRGSHCGRSRDSFKSRCRESSRVGRRTSCRKQPSDRAMTTTRPSDGGRRGL
jgi:hypothetical protein